MIGYNMKIKQKIKTIQKMIFFFWEHCVRAICKTKQKKQETLSLTHMCTHHSFARAFSIYFFFKIGFFFYCPFFLVFFFAQIVRLIVYVNNIYTKWWKRLYYSFITLIKYFLKSNNIFLNEYLIICICMFNSNLFSIFV